MPITKKKLTEEQKEEREKYYKKIKRLLPQIQNKPEVLTENNRRYIHDANMIVSRLLDDWEESDKIIKRNYE